MCKFGVLFSLTKKMVLHILRVKRVISLMKGFSLRDMLVRAYGYK